MVIVAAFWELNWNTPIKEVDLWQYPLRDFSVDKIYMVPVSGISNKKIIEKPTIEEVIKEHKNLQVIFITENGEHDLRDFVHPENALYIVGKTNYSPFNTLKIGNSTSVRVPTSINKGLLWGHQATSIVLYDRLVKNGSNNIR